VRLTVWLWPVRAAVSSPRRVALLASRHKLAGFTLDCGSCGTDVVMQWQSVQTALSCQIVASWLYRQNTSTP
jgi:hypothetical protein